ncbi:MAG: cytochrome c peroxidase, partial [Myxococcota bacterium]
MQRRVARTLAVILIGLFALGAGEPVEIAVPEGVFPPEVPADNPLSAEKIALGQRLYFDKRLSRDGTFAGASCHDPAHAGRSSRVAWVRECVGGALGSK